jgi:hypothetical protein
MAEVAPFPQNMRLFLACADLCKRYKVDETKFNYAFLKILRIVLYEILLRKKLLNDSGLLFLNYTFKKQKL